MNRNLLVAVAAAVSTGFGFYLAGIIEGPDAANGTLEFAGGIFIFMSVIKLHQEKVVRGVSWMHVGFFSAWGLWNLYYYPHLGQWFSFVGGLFLVLVNILWLGQIVYYLALERRKNVVVT